MKLKSIAGLSRNVRNLGWVSLFNDASSEMIYPLLPLFLTQVLGAGVVFVGLIEGIAESVSSFLKLFSGWLSDRIRKRKGMIVFGYSLPAITRPFIALATSPFHILFLRFLDRVGKGMRTSPRDALLSKSCGENERGIAFGFQRAMDHAGAIMGPLIATFLLATVTTDLRMVFLLAFLPSLATVLILVRGVTDVQENGSTSSASPPRLQWKGWNRKFKFFLVIITLFTLGNSSDAFLLLRAKDLGVDPVSIPILWVALHVSKMIFSIPGGGFSDRIGRRGVMITAWTVYGLVYLGFAFASKPYHIWLLFLIYGLFFGLSEGTERAWVADLVEEPKRGIAYGTYHFFIGIAALPASLLMGFLWKAAGVQWAFGLGAFLALVAALLALVLMGNAPAKSMRHSAPSPSTLSPRGRGEG